MNKVSHYVICEIITMIERTIDGTEEEMGNRKLKKTRRGKKRKLRNDLTPSEVDEEERGCAQEDAHQQNETDTNSSRAAKRVNSKPKCLLLRPTDVPKAPENSTQFIMDDHEDCNLYFSFETQRRRRQSTGDNNSVKTSEQEEEDGSKNSNIGNNENNGQFVGFQDIDFEYESPDDVDTNAFYERDFEIIYRSAREDELAGFSRDEMMAQCIELEERAIELERQITKLDVDTGSVTIGRLQEVLLKLQEENETLKNQNAQLVRIG